MITYIVNITNKLMIWREQYRNKDTTNMISQYNNHVINGMCSRR